MAPKPDKKKKPAQTSTEATQMLVAKCSRSTLEALILKSVLNAAPITLADLEATPVPSVPIAQGARRSYRSWEFTPRFDFRT